MSDKGKGSEKYATDEPKKGASDPDSKGGKADPQDLDMGAGIPSKGGAYGEASGDADSFVQEEAGGFGRPGVDSSGAGAITDSFGGGGDRTEGAGDLLNPDIPTSGQGSSPGTASWEDGPSDPSGGLTTGTGVANVSNRVSEYDDAVAEYDKTDKTWDDYNSVHNKLDDIDDNYPAATAVDEFFGGERERATQPAPEEPLAEQPLAAIDATDIDKHIDIGSDGDIYLDSNDGSLVRQPSDGESGLQSVAPGTADNVYLEQDQHMSTETVIVAEDDGLTEYAVNQQSDEYDVTYGFDKEGDYYAVDGNNNATPINRDDIPPGTRVNDLDNTLGDNGEGGYDQPEKADDGQDGGTDQDDSSDQDADDQASDDQAEQDSDKDGAEEGSDASTPSGEATGAERAAQAEALRDQGLDELVDRRDASGDAIDPGDIDTVEGSGGQPTSDAGISNPEGTSAVSGTGRAPGDPGNIDYGEDADRQYDGRETSPGDEVSVQNGSGLEGYAPGSDDSDSSTVLDPGDIDLGPPTLTQLDTSDTSDTSDTATELPIEFGGGLATLPTDRIDATDYGRGDPGPVEAPEDDPVTSDDSEDPAEGQPVDDYDDSHQQEEEYNTPSAEEHEVEDHSSEPEESDEVMMD